DGRRTRGGRHPVRLPRRPPPPRATADRPAAPPARRDARPAPDQAARGPAPRPLTARRPAPGPAPGHLVAATATPADTRIIPAHCHGPGASPSTSQPSRPIWGSIALLTIEDVPAVS